MALVFASMSDANRLLPMNIDVHHGISQVQIKTMPQHGKLFCIPSLFNGTILSRTDFQSVTVASLQELSQVYQEVTVNRSYCSFGVPVSESSTSFHYGINTVYVAYIYL
jgi:hypothetical protein